MYIPRDVAKRLGDIGTYRPFWVRISRFTKRQGCPSTVSHNIEDVPSARKQSSCSRQRHPSSMIPPFDRMRTLCRDRARIPDPNKPLDRGSMKYPERMLRKERVEG